MVPTKPYRRSTMRSEEHTSELQSRVELVCRLLLEKKKRNHAVACPPTFEYEEATCESFLSWLFCIPWQGCWPSWLILFFLVRRSLPTSTLFPYTTLFR